MSLNFRPYITRDPAICGDEPVVTGTRVTVRTVLASLAEGMETDELLLDFPTLSRDMTIKLDKNLPARLSPILKNHDHDIHTVPDERLSGRPDAENLPRWARPPRPQATVQESRSAAHAAAGQT